MNAQEEQVILLAVSFITCACMTVDELLWFDEDDDEMQTRGS